jgi:hypothetical protein
MADKDTPKRVVIELPKDANGVVGGTPRPPRPVTIGRRRTDRWMAHAALITFALLVIFVVYVTWRMQVITDAITHCPGL